MGVISVSAKLDDRGFNLDDIGAGLAETFLRSVGGVAHGAHSEWIRLAQNRLRTARADYVNGLTKADSFITRIVGGTTVFELTLIGRMPNNFEFGMDGFDMKAVRPGWLGGARAKTSKEGHKYVTIPFRHSLSSAAAIQYSGKAKRDNLRTELKNVVRAYGLDKMVRSATGQVIPGPVKRAPNVPSIHPYLRNLTRIQQPISGRTPGGKQRGQAQLMTWRVMSEKSPASSWIHPGITAANLMPEVERWIDQELDTLIESMFGT